MGANSSKSSQPPNPAHVESFDPCKRYGCALQSCIVKSFDRLNKPGQLIVEDECGPMREALLKCREEHASFYEEQQKELFGKRPTTGTPAKPNTS